MPGPLFPQPVAPPNARQLPQLPNDYANPQENYLDKGVQGLLGLVGLGNDNSRANRFGQVVGAAAPLVAGAARAVPQAAEMIAWLPHPGGGHIPVRIPHPNVWGAAGTGAEEVAAAAPRVLPQARAGAPLAAQAPMSPIEQFYATNPTARVGGGTYGVAEGRTTGQFREGAGGLNSLLPANQRPYTPVGPITMMDPYQSAFMAGPPQEIASPGSAATKFMRQNRTEAELARERQQTSRGRR